MTKPIAAWTIAGAMAATALGAQAPAPARPGAPAPARARAPQPPPVFEGIVVSPDGTPVVEAVIVLSAPGDPDPPIVARTAADGRFKVQARRGGPRTVRVEARGLAAQTIEKVAPGTPLRVALAKGGSIEGVVRDADTGQPVAGARIEAREDAFSGGASWEPGLGIVTAESDARGVFTLEGLARGRHTVTASSRGAGRASQSGVALGRRIELLLIAGPSIGGRVLTPDGKPVPGAAVRAESETRSGPPRVAGADARGRFDIAGLAPGAYRLVAYHKDWAVAIVAGARVERAGDVEVDIVLAPPARVMGRLVDTEERPLAGTITLQEVDGQPSPRLLGLLVRAEAGADGRFALEGVPPGSHALAVAGHGVASRRVPIDVGARQKAVDLGDVVLEAGAQIRGRVRDKAGAAIADATLYGFPDGPMAPGASRLEGRTDADGTFVLGGANAPVYRLSVQATGFAPATQAVDAPSEGVELVLEAAGVIEGLVVDDAGRPVESFEVSAMPAGGREAMGRQPPRGRPVVSEGGRFTLDGVAPGTYAVLVAAFDLGRRVVSDVKVAAGAVTDLGRIRLTAGGAVRGTVVDATSAPIAGAIVMAQGPEGPMGSGMSEVPETSTDAGGAFHLRGLTTGTVIVTARHPEYAEGRSGPLEVDPGKTAETSVVLTRGGRIEGIVRRRGVAALPELRIHLRPMSPGSTPSSFATPGPDGAFVFDRVPPGRVGVALMAPSTPGGTTGTGSFKEVEVREGEAARVEFVWREILLSGRVTRGGVALPSVRLTARAPDSGMFWGGSAGLPAPAAGPQRMTALTREDGGYEMIVSDPGRVTIRAQSTAGRAASFPSRVIEVADVDAQTADLDFPAGGVSGLVVDEETEAPVARAMVFAMPAERGRPGGGQATAGADGRFSLDVDPGEYRLHASAEGYAGNDLALTVGESPVGDVRITLSRGAPLRGMVLDRHGRPAPGVWVMVREDSSEVMGSSTESSLDGAFEFAALRPGSYSLAGGSPLSGFGMLTGVSPGAADVVLRLSPGGRIRVLVKGADGSAVSGAFVSVRRVNGARFWFIGAGGRTGPDGTTEFDSPPGAVEVEARKDDLWGRGQAAVTAGGLGFTEVTLTAGPPDP